MLKGLLASGKVRLGLAISLFFAIVAVFGGPFISQVLRIDPRAINYDAVSSPPSAAHWLGTNSAGQDVFAQLVVGTQGSVFVGVLSGIIATIIAVVIGAWSGFVGGTTDRFITAVINVVMTLPGFALLFIIAGYVQNASLVLIALVIGLLEWPGGARTIRSQTLSLRNRDFTNALHTIGESRWRIVSVEVVPHLSGVISAMFLKAVIAGIFAESALAFLGIGNTSGISWGTMIGQAQAQGAILRGMWWWFLPPGLCIAVIGFATAMINFGLDEITNPSLNAKLAAKTRRFNITRAQQLRARRMPIRKEALR